MRNFIQRFAMLLIFSHLVLGQTANWTKVNPVTSDYLQDVYAIDASTAIACGAAGNIVRTGDAGQSWYAISSNATTDLKSVYFINSTHGWIAGVNTILHTTDGGITWAEQLSSTDSFFDVFFLDSSTGWACGSFGAIYKTTDGGANWTNYPVGTNAWYFSIYFTDAQHGFVVGSNASYASTSDGGINWTGVEDPSGWGAPRKNELSPIWR